jgi:hypothetical protein
VWLDVDTMSIPVDFCPVENSVLTVIAQHNDWPLSCVYIIYGEAKFSHAHINEEILSRGMKSLFIFSILTLVRSTT